MITRSYSELTRLQTFEERFDYLKLDGGVGRATFGFDRYINQQFYTSREWRDIRSFVVVRDDGCDLAVPGREIHISPIVHHINPMLPEDIAHGADWILDPEFLILTTHDTHNAIHYGKERSPAPRVVIERSPQDTRLW